jgi:hypothetical protein
MNTHSSISSDFELLQLPDGRCYVARASTSPETTLIAGSFARLATFPDETDDEATDHPDPVGLYPSRDEAEVAILRASPSLEPAGPLDSFAPWLRQD